MIKGGKCRSAKGRTHVGGKVEGGLDEEFITKWELFEGRTAEGGNS